jgi:gas vesicle protein
MSKETNSFFKGLAFGAIVGAVAGILLAPKSGEETRKDIQKLAGDLKEKAVDVYSEARMKVEKKVKSLKALGKKIDEKKYAALVNEIVDEYKKKDVLGSDSAKKLATQLKKDWLVVKKAVVS